MAKTNAFERFVIAFGGVKALAHELGYSTASVYRWLNGERVPRWDTIVRIVTLSEELHGAHAVSIEEVVELTGRRRTERQS